MFCLETVVAARASWLASQSSFSVFDPDFGGGESLAAMLGQSPSCLKKASAKLRYVAVCENAFSHLAPGLHFQDMPEHNAELHLFVGPFKNGVAELQGKFDAVLHPQASQQFARWLNRDLKQIPQPRSIAVVGAGMAGSSVALALCKQGIRVHLHDTADHAAAGASGNWVGAFHPHITRGDSPLSKLSRLGFEHTLQALEALTASGFLQKGIDWDTPGHLQTVPLDECERTRDTLTQLAFPDALVRWVEPNELLPTDLSGMFFPQGGWVKPVRWVQANLQACAQLGEDMLMTHYGHMVGSLTALQEQHDAVVVCCAEQSINLAPIESARVGSVKGQISKLRRLHSVNVVLSGESYAIAPPQDDWMVLGATYERPVLDLHPTPHADDQNIARFKTAFPQVPVGELLDHRCAVRSVWHDRLPAIGPVPGMPGVYMSTGFASRGLLWAALGGWLVAGHCTGQPFESKLLGKIAPRGTKARSA